MAKSAPDIKLTIGSQMDFGKVPFTSARLCKRVGLVKIKGSVIGRAMADNGSVPEGEGRMDVALKWPTAAELDAIAERCRQSDVWRAFGFKRPLRSEYISRWRLPNGGGTFEPVEFLVVSHSEAERPFGFFVLYDFSQSCNRTNEMDFAIFDPELIEQINLISLKFIMLCYLFAIRGCAWVVWKRDKSTRYWTEDPQKLKRHLSQSEAQGEVLPQVILRSTPWSQTIFGGIG